MRSKLFIAFAIIVAGELLPTSAENGAIAQSPEKRPDLTQPGPWDNDVLVYRVGSDGQTERLATFERAGVPTAARMKDGSLIAAHQHFPENLIDFDKVAVRFSSDEGKNWSSAKVIRLTGLPEGMHSPFDPTLVSLPDGQIRLYFTSVEGWRNDRHQPAIYSAISSNGIDYAFEPGVRFGVKDRFVIDCAVVLHRGEFHLYAPDNGAGGPPDMPGAARGQTREPPREGAGYHAISKDGLTFTRQADVQIEGRRRWLGNAQSDVNLITFFGTGGPGIWIATSENGQDWELGPGLPGVPGADPGAVKLRDGGWLVIGTGPPRPGTPSARRGPRGN